MFSRTTQIIMTVEPETGHRRYYEGEIGERLELLSSHPNLQVLELLSISDEVREKRRYSITKIDKPYFNDGNVEIQLIKTG